MFCFTVFLIKLIMTSVPETPLSWSIDFFNFTFLFFFSNFIFRLASFGDKAFEFSFFRYGQPDPDLQRNIDMSLNLTMSSIQYVHTQRFLMEFISFCQHFLLLQEVLGRMRAASAGDEVGLQ